MPKNKKRSKRSPSPAPAKPAAKRLDGRRNNGREAYKPTDGDRALVELGAGLGIPEDELVHAVINPVTKRPISPITLRKYFRDELDRGLIRTKLKAGANLLAMTANNASAAIFFAKCRLGFNERASWYTPDGQPWRRAGTGLAPADPFAGLPDADIKEAEGKSMTEIARRIAYTLTIGMEQKTTAPAEPPADQAKPKQPGKNRVKKPVAKQPQATS